MAAGTGCWQLQGRCCVTSSEKNSGHPSFDTMDCRLGLAAILCIFAVTIQTGLAIKCWECNSHYDKNCADPFGNETFALTDCNQRDLEHFPLQKASVCRKIIQKVRDDYRFVRGCGWLSGGEKESTDCFKRAGTFNVLIQYCSCDSDGCNSAPHISTSWGLLLFGALLLAAAVK